MYSSPARASSSDLAAAQAHQNGLAREGYCIVREILTATQIGELRQAIKDYFSASGRYQYGGKFQLRGLHTLPAVARILSSNAVLDLVTQVTLPDRAVLTGECDLMINTLSGWHKDITDDMRLDRGIFRDPSFRVFKIAFYLQDQGETSRATLKVKPGSHLCEDGAGLPIRPVAVHAGDAIVFDVRIDHCGQLPTALDRVMRRMLEAMSRIGCPDAQERMTHFRSTIRRLSRRSTDRMAVFMTFGRAEPWTYAYEHAGRHRHGTPPAGLDSEMLQRLADKEIALLQASVATDL